MLKKKPTKMLWTMKSRDQYLFLNPSFSISKHIINFTFKLQEQDFFFFPFNKRERAQSLDSVGLAFPYMNMNWKKARPCQLPGFSIHIWQVSSSVQCRGKYI